MNIFKRLIKGKKSPGVDSTVAPISRLSDEGEHKKTQITQKSQEEILDGIGAWGEFLEGEAKKRLNEVNRPEYWPLEFVENTINKVVSEIGGFIGGLIIVEIQESPEWVSEGTVSKQLIDHVMELAKNAQNAKVAQIVNDLMTIEDAARNLKANPEIWAEAQKNGKTPEGAAKYINNLAKETIGELEQAVSSAVPLVIDIAKGTQSVAMLQNKLTAATRSTDGGSTLEAVFVYGFNNHAPSISEVKHLLSDSDLASRVQGAALYLSGGLSISPMAVPDVMSLALIAGPHVLHGMKPKLGHDVDVNKITLEIVGNFIFIKVAK